MEPVEKAEASLLALAIALAALFVAAPLMLPHGSVPALDGRAGNVDNYGATDGMPVVPRAIYLLGDVNCHQLADRSYELNGNQLPVCARDMGILAGFACGMALLMLRPVRFSWAVFLLLLAPMAADGGVQALTSYESTNAVRAVTGLIAGVGVAMLMSKLAGSMLSPEE